MAARPPPGADAEGFCRYSNAFDDTGRQWPPPRPPPSRRDRRGRRPQPAGGPSCRPRTVAGGAGEVRTALSYRRSELVMRYSDGYE
jgi:hypothetical protein